MNQFEAAISGNIAWFFNAQKEHCLPDLMLQNNVDPYAGYYVHEHAAENGHLEVLKFIIEHSHQKIDILADDIFIFEVALQNNQLHIIKYLFEEALTSSQLIECANSVARFAISYGYLSTVEYLVEQYESDINIVVDQFACLRDAAENGHLATLSLAIETWPQFELEDINVKNRAILHSVVINGHLEILKYLFENFNAYIKINDDNNQILCEAIENGKTEVVKYLLEECPQKKQLTLDALYNTSFRQALQDGHLDVVKYLMHTHCYMVDESTANRYYFNDALTSSNLALIKYLIEETNVDISVLYSSFSAVFLEASEAVVEYLCSINQCIELITPKVFQELRELSAEDTRHFYSQNPDSSLSSTMLSVTLQLPESILENAANSPQPIKLLTKFAQQELQHLRVSTAHTSHQL